MPYQINSGLGPAECELGVAKFLEYLTKSYSVTVLETSKGYHEGTYCSVKLSSETEKKGKKLNKMDTAHIFGTEKISRILLRLAPPVMLAQLILLIFGLFGVPELGIGGAAVATVAGQVVAALIVAKKGYKKPPALQTFFFIPLGAMQTCIVPVISFNYAARNIDRCKKTLTKIIKKIADNGRCVIVGRTADYVLKDHENVIRVFIHVPKQYRMKRVMEVYGDTPKEARRNIHRSNKARAAYYKHISGRRWADGRHYRLSVDSSIGVQETASLIMSYVSITSKDAVNLKLRTFCLISQDIY